ncbi:MAG: transposase [Saprospiraceae bacterium]|nr:transposase [Saprospiraceae bacterium]
MSKIRSKTVEPVLGTLMNFLGMRRVHTRGIEAAKKHTLMASLCYNLKKLMKHSNPKTKTFAQSFEKFETAVKSSVF